MEWTWYNFSRVYDWTMCNTNSKDVVDILYIGGGPGKIRKAEAKLTAMKHELLKKMDPDADLELLGTTPLSQLFPGDSEWEKITKPYEFDDGGDRKIYWALAQERNEFWDVAKDAEQGKPLHDATSDPDYDDPDAEADEDIDVDLKIEEQRDTVHEGDNEELDELARQFLE